MIPMFTWFRKYNPTPNRLHRVVGIDEKKCLKKQLNRLLLDGRNLRRWHWLVPTLTFPNTRSLVSTKRARIFGDALNSHRNTLNQLKPSVGRRPACGRSDPAGTISAQ
ncbi:hypothetical protein R6Q57_026849 [Mikania cordata]